MNVKNETVLISGGSSGIGLELSKLFAADGFNLILVSKPEDELKEAQTILEQNFPEVKIITIQKDLTNAKAAEEVFQQVEDMGLAITVLVNNAGFGTYGYFSENDMNTEYQSILLNCGAVYKMTRLFLPGMIARNRGFILNVSSVAAFQPNPLFCVYGATKAFVLSMSKALRFELKKQKTGVSVTTLCPPPTRTKFIAAAGMQKSAMFRHIDSLDAATVARYGYKALFNKTETIIPGGYIGVLYRLVNILLPQWLVMQLAYFKLSMKIKN